MTGNWIALTNQPTFNASTMLLLNDGRVMCQESGGVRWWSLSPDIHGSYINGAWQQLAPMAHTRLYYGSAVFADGRVIVTGGEYSDAGKETNSCELYDPVLDQWTTISPPAGWAEVGDGSSVLLPDGRYLTGNASDAQTAIYDPVAGTWSAGPTMAGRSAEETWVLMPDETILAPRCIGHPAAEKLVLAANQWMSAGTLPVDLVEAASAEIGPGMTLPDGRAFFLGATGASALYTPPAIASQPGTWSAGPTLPPDANGLQLGAKDAPGCLLPNGNVLLAVGPVDGVKDDYLSPTTFYEFDGSGFIKVPDPANVGGPPFTGRMMLLPTGEVLFASGSAAMYAYRPSGAPQSVWQPSITAAPSFARRGSTYTLHGRQLNGLSQAVAYGDDAASATNYPLVRIRHLGSGRVTYCRTFDHSTMAIGTGAAVHSTNFTVPCTAPTGFCELSVVVNGIASAETSMYVGPLRIFWPIDEAAIAYLFGSLADGPLWVLGPNGPVPVDPQWRGAKEAAEARADIIRAIGRLQKLGASAAAERAEAAAGMPAAIDEDYAAFVKSQTATPTE